MDRRSGKKVYLPAPDVMFREKMGWGNWDKYAPINIEGINPMPIWCPTFYKSGDFHRPNAGTVFNGVGRSSISEILLPGVRDFRFGFNKIWYGTPTLVPGLPEGSPEEWEPHPSCMAFFGAQFHEWHCCACAGWAKRTAGLEQDEEDNYVRVVRHSGVCEALLSRNPRHSPLAHHGCGFGLRRRLHECTMTSAPETVTDGYLLDVGYTQKPIPYRALWWLDNAELLEGNGRVGVGEELTGEQKRRRNALRAWNHVTPWHAPAYIPERPRNSVLVNLNPAYTSPLLHYPNPYWMYMVSIIDEM